nr:glycosyltransferase family A protein [uncultured Rhodopila sp.]
MHISVIIPAYNVAPYLRDAMTSVIRQTHGDWSMVVVDDGSIDSTARVASGFTDRRISLIRQDNAGVSAARNRGVAGSTSDACLFLDADDWLAPDALARLAQALAASPASVASAGPYARQSIGGIIRFAPPPGCEDLLERLLVRNLFANGGHLLIRRSAIDRAGGFRTGLRYGEDWEYWTRLALLGDFVPAASRDPVLFVRVRPGSAYLRMATDPARFEAATGAIYGNPDIIRRFGADALRALRRRADAETAWVIGRELIRHGRHREGWRCLGKSLCLTPSLRRLALAGLSPAGMGPFRPYPARATGGACDSMRDSRGGIHQ